jgi:hypothetical protein
VLQVRERTPPPSPFVVFTFGLTVESIEEFRGSIIKKILGKKSDMELRFVNFKLKVET